MNSVRKEDEISDSASIGQDLKKIGWKITPLSSAEFGFIHASRPKNLMCTIKGSYPRMEPVGTKVIRKQTLEIGEEGVTGEFRDYTVFIPTKGRFGSVIEIFRGFNQNLKGSFDDEEKSVHFMLRSDIRKIILEFEHAMNWWEHVRAQAKNKKIRFINKEMDKIEERALKCYNLSTDSTKNVDRIFDELIKVKQIQQDSWAQTEEFLDKVINLIRRASIASPGMFALEEIAADLVVKALKCAMINAIKTTASMDDTGRLILEQMACVIRLYTNELHLISNDPETKLDDLSKRITVINSGKNNIED